MSRCAALVVVALAWAACAKDSTATTSDPMTDPAGEADVAVAPDVAPEAETVVETCTGCTDVEADADAESETVTPKPLLSARKTATIADLATGDNSYAVAGKSWVIENSRTRFVIQDKDVAVHLGLFGGNLIDVDQHREAGEPGNDQWREAFPIVGFRGAAIDKIEVIADGSDGKQAILRVSGHDAPTGIIGFLDAMAQPINSRIVTDYTLQPDEPWVRMHTEVYNDGEFDLENQAIGEFLSFGGAQNVFAPETGFANDPGSLSVLASVGRGASYGYTRETGPVTIPIVDASGTVAILSTTFNVPSKGHAGFDRVMIVGTGDIESVVAAGHLLRHEAMVAVTGTVKDADGKPVAGALVTALAEGKGTPGKGGKAVTQAAVAADGTYRIGLPAGKWDLVASADGRLRVMTTVDLTAGPATADLAMGGQGVPALQVREVDAGGQDLGAIPGKASLYCATGGEAPWDQLNEGEKYGLCQAIFSTKGANQTPVKPGHYKVLVSRGPEYEQFIVDDLEVVAGQTAQVIAKLLRSVDTTGYLSADFHQHTMGSLDAAPTHLEKVGENLAENVEIAAITDHDNMTSYTPAITQLGVGKWIRSLDGDEVSVNGVGHFNIFSPQGTVLDADRHDGNLFPYVGGKLFANRTIPEVFAAVRQIAGVRDIHVNHPRDGIMGYLSWMAYDPILGVAHAAQEPMAWDFDSIETKDSLGTPDLFLPENDASISSRSKGGDQSIPILMDWFSLLNLGRHTCAVGASDAHARNSGVGYSRNFLRLGVDRPDQTTMDAVIDAVLAQKDVVSNGPFLQVFVDGVEKMGHTEVVSAPSKSITVRLKVQAASWMNVSSLQVYGNGRPIAFDAADGALTEAAGTVTVAQAAVLTTAIPIVGSMGADPVVRADVPITLHPQVDTWYVFVVQGTGNLSPVGNGHPFAYNNPLYVDVDGGGFKALHQQQ